MGAKETISIDASAYEGASLVHDMNVPIGDELKRKFSVVIDGGTLEHIFNFPVAIQNCMQMLDVGGHFFSHTMANNFMGHGFYQFSPELFYRVFSAENGFRVHRVVVFEQRVGRPRWYEAADPNDIDERVELINGRPTYLFVHAERLADVPIFAAPPQQPDYSRALVAQHGAALRLAGAAWARASLGQGAQRFLSALFAGSALRPGAVDAGARPAEARLSPPPIHAAAIVAALSLRPSRAPARCARSTGRD